jgi:replication-associated recombination protein RarA
VVEQAYLDGKVANSVYYEPKDLGIEKELGERWSKLRAIIRAFRK